MWFTKTHEWIKVEGDVAVVGITDFAQQELGDIVHVELPQIGKLIKAGDESAVLESTKAAVDVYAPVSGHVQEVNESLRQSPEKINQAAESEGWLYKITLTQPDECQQLMDRATYFSGKKR